MPGVPVPEWSRGWGWRPGPPNRGVSGVVGWSVGWRARPVRRGLVLCVASPPGPRPPAARVAVAILGHGQPRSAAKDSSLLFVQRVPGGWLRPTAPGGLALSLVGLCANDEGRVVHPNHPPCSCCCECEPWPRILQSPAANRLSPGGLSWRVGLRLGSRRVLSSSPRAQVKSTCRNNLREPRPEILWSGACG